MKRDDPFEDCAAAEFQGLTYEEKGDALRKKMQFVLNHQMNQNSAHSCKRNGEDAPMATIIFPEKANKKSAYKNKRKSHSTIFIGHVVELFVFALPIALYIHRCI